MRAKGVHSTTKLLFFLSPTSFFGWGWEQTAGGGSRLLGVGADCWGWEQTAGGGSRLLGVGADCWGWEQKHGNAIIVMKLEEIKNVSLTY
jgi:hypothetical protein